MRILLPKGFPDDGAGKPVRSRRMNAGALDSLWAVSPSSLTLRACVRLEPSEETDGLPVPHQPPKLGENAFLL